MTETSSTGTVEAGLTPWYFRRMIILLVMFFGFGAYFAYDWQIGYPKKKVIYERYLDYKAQGEEGLREWAKVSKEEGIDFENEAEMAPFKVDDGKIQQQFWGMVVCFLIGAVVAVFFLRSLGTKLGVDERALRLPRRAPVPFGDIRVVDTRKWLNKGLARVVWEESGSSRKGVIDGMKYGGFKGEKPYLPDLILERVVDRFTGELIEIEEIDDEEKATDGVGGAEEERGDEVASKEGA